MNRYRRIFCVVLDGVGVGQAPDDAAPGDVGSNSIANTARVVGALRLENLGRLGLGNITPIAGVPPVERSVGWYGKLTPRGAGKDSTSGHWELMGCPLDKALPTYPHGFPRELLSRFETAIDRGTLCNRPASGTAVIAEFGAEQMDTGKPIVYTSEDSVFQIAAHEAIVPVDELYRMCEIARKLLVTPHGVGRVIARPFVGDHGNFHRTPRRRDFSLAPPGDTVLDLLMRSGREVYTIGKIDDLFSGRGISRSVHTRDNRDGMERTMEAVLSGEGEFVFVNLVDFDTMWGHRNDARAYALGLEEFDSFLSDVLPALRDDDLLIITSDHGNDPTTVHGEHSREYVPVIVYSAGRGGSDLGVRSTLADVGATIADALGVRAPRAGASFLEELGGV